tara:strand:+ start:804 stop:1028 length:225 start_codon:yes stop_codon:yes gene_type:complete
MTTIEELREEQALQTKGMAELWFESGDDISVSLIQRRCEVGYYSASMAYDMMVKEELIIPDIVKSLEALKGKIK